MLKQGELLQVSLEKKCSRNQGVPEIEVCSSPQAPVSERKQTAYRLGLGVGGARVSYGGLSPSPSGKSLLAKRKGVVASGDMLCCTPKL